MCQAKTLGWPLAFSVDNLTDETLHKAFDYCQTEEARFKAKECRDRAIRLVEQLRDKFISALDLPSSASARVWREEALDKSLLEPPRLTIRQRLLNQARDIKKRVVYAIVKWLLGNKKLK